HGLGPVPRRNSPFDSDPVEKGDVTARMVLVRACSAIAVLVPLALLGACGSSPTYSRSPGGSSVDGTGGLGGGPAATGGRGEGGGVAVATGGIGAGGMPSAGGQGGATSGGAGGGAVPT